MIQAIKGSCDFEVLHSSDLLSAVQSLSGRFGAGLIQAPLGDGFERFLQWAIADIKAAATTNIKDDEERFATNAVMNARRVLSCLVDQYLTRDAVTFCKDAPSSAKEKAQVLIARHVFDELTSAVLERAIERRNRAEHQYYALPLKEAQDIVELVRRTIESVTKICDPYSGSCLFMSCSLGYSTKVGAQFFSWNEPALIVATFDSPAWLGIILPTSKAHAIVRKIFIGEVDVSILLRVLQEAEQNFPGGVASYSTGIWRDISREAGLIATGQ